MISTNLRFRAALAALLAATQALSSPIAMAAAAPELHIDCSFTGTNGDLCKSAAEEWAAKRKVKVVVERRTMTSTEKLERFTKLLEAKSPEFDVFGADVTWPGVLHKHLLDLDPYFKGGKNAYLPTYIENNTVNGRLLAVPFMLSLGLMFYRTDLLSKYRLNVPETWADLEAAALKIQAGERAAGNAGFWGYVWQGKAYEGLSCNALEWIGSHNGGNLVAPSGQVRINTTNVFEALRIASGWIGKISPPETLTNAEKETHESFRQGKAAFLRAWPSAWTVVTGDKSPIEGKVGVMLVPKGGARGTHVSALGGYSLAISRYTKHPELAAELVKYLSTPAEQKRRALLAGNPPTLTSLYQDEEIIKSAPYEPIMLFALANAAVRPARTTRNDYPEVSREFWSAVHLILEGKQSPLQSMSALQQKLDKLSSRWKKR